MNKCEYNWGEPERAPYGIEKRPPRTIYLSMYVFCANRGSGPSMDCLAQTVDRALSGQTVDRLRKAWIKLAQSVDVGQTVDSYC